MVLNCVFIRETQLICLQTSRKISSDWQWCGNDNIGKIEKRKQGVRHMFRAETGSCLLTYSLCFCMLVDFIRSFNNYFALHLSGDLLTSMSCTSRSAPCFMFPFQPYCLNSTCVLLLKVGLQRNNSSHLFCSFLQMEIVNVSLTQNEI